jgi:hypothetical protein
MPFTISPFSGKFDYYQDVSSIGSGLFWLQASDQTLLTGDKSGSFDLTTTGTGTFGRLDIGSNYITSIKGSGPNDYVMYLIGLQGTSDSTYGQMVGLRGGKGYSILTTGNAGVGGGFGGGGGEGGDKTLTEYFSITQQGGTGGSLYFYSGSGGKATTAVTNQKITGGQGGQT